MAFCAAARVTWPSQTAVCGFVSTGSFALFTPEPFLWPGSGGSTHELRQSFGSSPSYRLLRWSYSASPLRPVNP